MTRRAERPSILRAAKWLPVAVLLLPVGPAVAGARQINQPPPPSGMGRQPHPGGDNANEPNPFGASNSAKLEHLREDDRRKHMLADTAKLVALSTELNDEVQKTTKDELSVEVVRKAAEIEKLARDVKDRMRS